MIMGMEAVFPLNLGSSVTEEEVSATFVSSQSNATAWCLIDNGALATMSFTPVYGLPIYLQPPANNVVDAARNILQKYQTYVTQHSTANLDLTYLQQAVALLEQTNNLAITEKTSGNMKIKISFNSAYTSISWVYIQNDYEVSRKSIQLEFRGRDFIWFGDSWNLYRVSNSSSISKDEAVSIGFAAAQNYTLNLTYSERNGDTTVQVKPDWTNMTYQATFCMLPGSAFNQSLPSIPGAPAIPSNVIPSKTVRDPLTLYPVWQLGFYFNKQIGDIVGIEVGFWGDTGELIYCNEYGVLGPPMPNTPPQPNTSPQPNTTPPEPTSTPEPSTPPQQSDTQSSNTAEQSSASQPQPYVIVGIVVAATIIISTTCVIVRKRNKQTVNP